MPQDRPHTVHGSHLEAGHEEEEDDQATPRASLAGLSILPETVDARRSLSRDDTATDMSAIMPTRGYRSTVDIPGYEPQTARYCSPMPHQEQFAAWAGNTSSAFAQRPIPTSTPRSRQASADVASGSNKQVRSLGRRLSRNWKEGRDLLREGFTRHAPLPARMRRSSTPHHAAAAAAAAEVPAHSNGTIDPRYLVAPLSPSKRNARQGDHRARKFRSTFGLNLGDRKDTPAPPPAFAAASRPAPRPAAGSLAQLHGGESARAAAAAASASHKPSSPDMARTSDDYSHEDLNTRRGRVCSLSSAADSGADLSKADDDSCKDSVGDAEDMEIDDFVHTADEAEPKRQNFVQTLPSEIALAIFEYLDAKELCRAQRVCRQWNELGNEASIWRAAFLRQYDRKVYTDPAPVQVGGVGAGRFNKTQQEWQKMYRARRQLEANWRKGPRDAGKAVYLSGHTDSVYCLQFDEEKIITGSRDRTIRVWDINTFQCIKVIGGPNVRPSLGPKVLRTVDYPHFHLATASVNGTAYGESIYHTPSQWHDASILCLQYDDDILVTGSSDSDLLVWDIHTYEPIHRLHKHTGGVLDVALDARHIVSCSKDSRIIVWDRATYTPRGELSGHRGPVNAVQLRGSLLVSASGDGIARLWDLDTLKLLKEFPAKERGLAAVEFSEDTRHVLAGGNDHVTYKFEVATGAEVAQFTGHTQLVRSLWLDSANARVVSGSYDLDLRVYDFATGQELWRAEEWTTSWMLAAKSDYRRIVATSQDGRILVVDFGLVKGGLGDGQAVEGVELLRGVERTNAIVFRNPWRGGEEVVR